MHCSVIRFLSALVPIFGLMSCTQDKSTAELSDSWTMNRPQIQGKHGADTALRGLSDAAVDPISVDSDIVFSNKTGEDFSQMTIESTVVCRSPSGETRQLSKANGVEQIPILGLIPSQIWLSLDNNELKSASCSFHFQVVNSIGSSFQFEVANVRFSNPETLETLRLNSKLADSSRLDADPLSQTSPAPPTILAANSAALRLSLAPEADLNMANDQNFKRDFELLCDHLRNHRARENQESAIQVFNELINGGIDDSNNHVAPTLHADPRSSFTHQNCRIIERSLNEQTGISRIVMSHLFQLIYPRAGAIISGQLALEAPGFIQVHYGTNPFMTITIANPTTAPLAFRFPAVRKHMIYLQPVIAHTNSSEIQREIGMDFSIGISGAFSQQADGEDIVFVVTAGATATITAIFSEHMTCFEGTGPGEIFGGFTYRTDVPLSLRQYQNWDPQNGSLTGTVDDISPIPAATGALPNAVNAGWIPNSQYIQRYPERKNLSLQGELDVRFISGPATCILGDDLVPVGGF